MSSKLWPGDPKEVMVTRKVTDQITTFSLPFARFGILKFGGRGTLVKLSSGSLLIVSPVALTPSVREVIESEGGRLRYITAPDMEHHLHLTAWKKAFPDAEIIAPHGLFEKRQSNPEFKDTEFTHIFTPENKKDKKISDEFHTDFDVEYVHSHGSREVVLLHKPSRTMIEADLIFNLPGNEQYSKTGESPTSNFATRLVAPLISTNPPKWHQRFAWYVLSGRDRPGFTESMKRIDQWDFDRIIPCHGDVIETDGKNVFRNVMKWFVDDKKHQS